MTVQSPSIEPYVESFDNRLRDLYQKPMLDVHVCDHCYLRCAGCLPFAPTALLTFCRHPPPGSVVSRRDCLYVFNLHQL